MDLPRTAAVLALLAPLLACEQIATALDPDCGEGFAVLYDVHYSISLQDSDHHYVVTYRDDEGKLNNEKVHRTSFLWSDPSFTPGSSATLRVVAPCVSDGCLTPTTRLKMEIVVDGEVVASDEASVLADGEGAFRSERSISYTHPGCLR